MRKSDSKATLHNIEAEWRVWLAKYSEEFPDVAAQLDENLPSIMQAMLPSLSVKRVKSSVVGFFMSRIMSFLTELGYIAQEERELADSCCDAPKVLIIGEEIKVAPSREDSEEIKDDALSDSDELVEAEEEVPQGFLYKPVGFDFFWSQLLSRVVGQMLLFTGKQWGDCARVFELLDPWPRNSLEWVIWLLQAGQYVQHDDGYRRMCLGLELMGHHIDKGVRSGVNEADCGRFTFKFMQAVKEYLRTCLDVVKA